MQTGAPYTARNSRRPIEHAPLREFIAPVVPDRQAIRAGERLSAIRKAAALRAAYRLERDCDVAFSGTPYERGIQHMLSRLHSIREAENIDMLFIYDRHVGGMIDGAYWFSAITLGASDKLRALRRNAFERRRQELMP